MENENSSKQIPDRWELGVRVMRNGSKRKCYSCPESRQRFFKYEDMMRYVKYAKEAKLSIYSPNFRPHKRKKRGGLPAGKQLLSGQSSEASAANQSDSEYMADSTESDSASEDESVPSQANPEAVLVLSQESTNQAPTPAQESTNQAPTPVKPQSAKGHEEVSEE